MLTTFGQYLGGKVVTIVLGTGAVGALIWFWRNPDDLQTIWHTIKYALVWLGFVALLPWATFFVTTWVVSKDSNLASGLMLAGYLVLDVVVAFSLIGRFTGLGSLSLFVLLLGFLAAAVYNFKVCEYQASRLERL